MLLWPPLPPQLAKEDGWCRVCTQLVSQPDSVAPPWHLETREGQGYYPLHPHPHPTQETELCSLRPNPPSVTSLAHTEPVACRMFSCLHETPKRIWWGVGGRSRERYQKGPAGGEGISLGNETSRRGIFLEPARLQRARSTD